MVHCRFCKTWYHYLCLGIDIEEEEWDENDCNSDYCIQLRADEN